MRHRREIRHNLKAEGFTLIEMLVSVTLIALMALAIWAALRISISSWKRGTESIDTNQRHRATLDLVQKQMASISALIPTLDLQTGTGQTPIFAGSEKSVQFISLCPLRFRDNPGLTVVSYEVVSGSGGDQALVERETRYLGGDPTLDVSFASVDEPVTTIFDHLADVVFEYYDPGTTDVPAQWVKDWSAQDSGRLPTAMSMTVNTRDATGATQSRHMVIPIMAETDNSQPGFTDPFGGRGGGLVNPPPGGRRGGPGFTNPPPGGRRGGPGFTNPPYGGRQGGRFR